MDVGKLGIAKYTFDAGAQEGELVRKYPSNGIQRYQFDVEDETMMMDPNTASPEYYDPRFLRDSR